MPKDAYFDDDGDPNEPIDLEEVTQKMTGGVVVGSFGSLAREPIRNEGIGRNHSCPCSSGKRYKRCCGKS